MMGKILMDNVLENINIYLKEVIIKEFIKKQK